MVGPTVAACLQRHAGTIKRHGLTRVKLAGEKLAKELEYSCTGLIAGYTGGYANALFDELQVCACVCVCVCVCMCVKVAVCACVE